ncbi:MAG: hypothetical protein AAB573_02395 [Patescibacteria group bacterium]
MADARIIARFEKMFTPERVAAFYAISPDEARRRLARDQEGTMTPMTHAIRTVLDKTADTSRA